MESLLAGNQEVECSSTMGLGYCCGQLCLGGSLDACCHSICTNQTGHAAISGYLSDRWLSAFKCHSFLTSSIFLPIICIILHHWPAACPIQPVQVPFVVTTSWTFASSVRQIKDLIPARSALWHGECVTWCSYCSIFRPGFLHFLPGFFFKAKFITEGRKGKGLLGWRLVLQPNFQIPAEATMPSTFIASQGTSWSLSLLWDAGRGGCFI